ncbi:MAG: ribosomal protein S18-alanine N-acetyltransferase [Clostridiales bacterium]|jgi:ribosomal-protein-alanine N-acetyltransferase|nr:ribosomal protein S18-alanine N-acetyltransferase [Clostridiales bacterium]
MVEYEEMTLRHLDEVYAIETASFTVPWSRKALSDEITSNDLAHYIVALDDGKVIGYAGLWHVVNEGHITNVAVSPERRKEGIGEALLKRLIAYAESKEMIGLMLEVRVSNYDAQRIYFKNGFELEHIRKRYYSDTREDALVLWKKLEPGAWNLDDYFK